MQSAVFMSYYKPSGMLTARHRPGIEQLKQSWELRATDKDEDGEIGRSEMRKSCDLGEGMTMKQGDSY